MQLATFVAIKFVEFLNAWEDVSVTDVTGQDVTMDTCAARNIFFICCV